METGKNLGSNNNNNTGEGKIISESKANFLLKNLDIICQDEQIVDLCDTLHKDRKPKKLSTDIKLKNVGSLYNNTTYDQYDDSIFPTYNANLIKNTSYIIGEGPQPINTHSFQADYRISPARLFENIIFNPQLDTKKPVTILRLGRSNPPGHKGVTAPCFIDYCFPKESYALKGEKIEFSVMQLESPSYRMIGLNCEWRYRSENSLDKLEIIRKANGKEASRIINVYTIVISDATIIPIDETKDFELFQKVYDASKEGYLFVHCASGIGRAGHAVFSMMLTDNFDEVVIEDDIKKTTENLINLLKRLRESRAFAVAGVRQFKQALKIAVKLYLNQKKTLANTNKNSEINDKKQEITTLGEMKQSPLTSPDKRKLEPQSNKSESPTKHSSNIFKQARELERKDSSGALSASDASTEEVEMDSPTKKENTLSFPSSKKSSTGE